MDTRIAWRRDLSISQHNIGEAFVAGNDCSATETAPRMACQAQTAHVSICTWVSCAVGGWIDDIGMCNGNTRWVERIGMRVCTLPDGPTSQRMVNLVSVDIPTVPVNKASLHCGGSKTIPSQCSDSQKSPCRLGRGAVAKGDWGLSSSVGEVEEGMNSAKSIIDYRHFCRRTGQVQGTGTGSGTGSGTGTGGSSQGTTRPNLL